MSQIFTFNLFIEHGANIFLEDKCGRFASHWAAELGLAECLALILERGANERINEIDGEGNTLLNVACTRKNNGDCIKMILRHGANRSLFNTKLFLGHMDCCVDAVSRNAIIDGENVEEKYARKLIEVQNIYIKIIIIINRRIDNLFLLIH